MREVETEKKENQFKYAVNLNLINATENFLKKAASGRMYYDPPDHISKWKRFCQEQCKRKHRNRWQR